MFSYSELAVPIVPTALRLYKHISQEKLNISGESKVNSWGLCVQSENVLLIGDSNSSSVKALTLSSGEISIIWKEDERWDVYGLCVFRDVAGDAIAVMERFEYSHRMCILRQSEQIPSTFRKEEIHPLEEKSSVCTCRTLF